MTRAASEGTLRSGPGTALRSWSRSPETGSLDPAAENGAQHRSGLAASVPWARRRVLLLNATFEPLTALPMRRAIVLLVCGKAEIVHGDPTGMVLHSARSNVLVPSVIKLSSYVRVPYRGQAPLTRAGLMHRDRYRCVYCGARAETIDHVVPRSRGGAHSWQNCVASCAKCNHRKADKLLTELGWRLCTTPSAPRGMHWRLLADVPDADPLWRPYLGAPAA
ncbi:HNH endonuclease [Tamaricihabitans halophyticus]|uniref:HNH endonuclease n=1 Tax=Tamaricihabitans halophyticus TaxID=1262583 RepID=UPI001404FFB8